MNVREFITVLTDMGADADIREFEVLAFDANEEGLAPVTGLIISTTFRTLEIQTDEL